MSQMTEPASQANGSKPDGIESFFDRTLADLQAQRRVTRSRNEADPTVRMHRWAEFVADAESLRRRLAGQPRVLAFELSHDQQELSVKIAGASGRAHHYFVVSRHHPDTLEVPPLECIWLRQIGQPDLSFADPQEALRELALRVARLLA